MGPWATASGATGAATAEGAAYAGQPKLTSSAPAAAEPAPHAACRGAAAVAGHARLCHNRRISAAERKEEWMAKERMRNNKEAKKPKADKPKSSMSEYKKSQGGTGQSLQPAGQEVLSLNSSTS